MESRRLAGGRVYLKLAGVDDREAAEALRGATIEVPLEQAVRLPPGSYYWHQLIGLAVETKRGESLGRLVDILTTGSNDVYVVRDDARELLLPAIRDVIREVDLENGRMVVELLPGLGP